MFPELNKGSLNIIGRRSNLIYKVIKYLFQRKFVLIDKSITAHIKLFGEGMGRKNIKIEFRYDGSRYYGFQRQPKKITVQGEI